MNKAILHPEVQKFILKNQKVDLPQLILKGSPFPEITIQEIAIQIAALKKAQKKLPTWYAKSSIIYPEALNLEQTSSETTAKYKASLIYGDNLIDLTGGFGIDDYYFADNFKVVTHCEINTELSEIVAHNFNVLEKKNIKTINCDSIKFLNEHEKQYTWIYLDPARRDDHGGKVFRLDQCTPNIVEHLDLLFNRTNNILIKTSPLLDIKAGILELDNVKEVHIVSVNNEVKELLWVIEKNYTDSIKIKTVNIFKESIQKFEGWFNADEESYNLSLPLNYLFEPNPAIMKSGLFGTLSKDTETSTLHQNSHLYTSQSLVEFPGRKFEVVEILEYNKKYLKKHFKSKKANVTTRNFPKSVEALREELKIKDGGVLYLFFTTDMNNRKIVISCKKI